MKRRIDLLDEHYTVTVFGQPGEWRLQVGDGELGCQGRNSLYSCL